MAEHQFKRLSFERGYVFQRSRDLITPDGAVSYLGNWYPTDSGGLKARGRWFRGVPQGGTAPTEVGSLHFSPLAIPIGGIFTSEKTGTDVEIRRSSGPYSAPSWILVDTLVGIASGSWNQHVPFASGINRLLYGNTSFPSNRLRIWDGAAPANASTAGVAGRTLAFHKERFFSGGPDWNGSALHFSGLGSATDWDIARYIEVRASNGGTIVDACPVNQGLLIAKTNSLHLLTGDGPGTFSVVDIMGGEGTSGRCIAATPYGAVIVGSSGIYLWDGGGAVQTLVPNDDWIFFDSSPNGAFPASCIYVNGIVYVMSTFQNACWAIDLERGIRWLQFTNTGVGADNDDVFHFDGLDYISVLTGAGFTAAYDNEILIGAGITGATAPGVSYLTQPQLTSDFEFPTDYRWRKDRVALGSPAHPATLLHVHLQTRGGQINPSGPLTVRAQAIVGATSTEQIVTVQTPISGGVPNRWRLDFGLTGYHFDFEMLQEVSALAETVYDIDDVLLEYEVNPER